MRTQVAPETDRTPGVWTARHHTRPLADMSVLRDCGESAELSDIDDSRQDGGPKPGLLATGGNTWPTRSSVPSIV